MAIRRADVIIIGSGLAGLMAAEILSTEKNVIIITKSKLGKSNSKMAQGGIAAAVAKEDDWREHFLDTIVAGGYHNNEEITKMLVQKGPVMIDKLTKLGVKFDKDETGTFSLGKEGAHRRRRILHAGGDATGKEIIECLVERLKGHVTIYENEMAIDFIIDNKTCTGVYTQDADGIQNYYIAPHTILATGGAGQLYEVTSNCSDVTGDGMAMAYRAGVELIDMEFVQFHPTMIVKNNQAVGLVSEAVRGEGARLILKNGKFLMDGIHELKDLAPRDVVSREIHLALQQGKQLFLDISTIPSFEKRFPSITSICNKAGVDIKTGKIPVAPGAHFIMGGVAVNEKGETSLKGLYAAGEVSQTGVHGANRLASNSLLEAVVFANEVATNIMKQPAKVITDVPSVKLLTTNVSLPTIEEIKAVMTKFVGIVRTKSNLLYAKKWFEQFQSIIRENRYYHMSNSEKIICNLLTIGYCITISALHRTESRGGHFRTDYPIVDRKWFQKKLACSIDYPKPLIKKELKKITMTV